MHVIVVFEIFFLQFTDLTVNQEKAIRLLLPF